MFYPYTTPIVLNDVNFAEFGGETGTATVSQRQSAYAVAEFQTSYWLQAFLTDTIITGEHKWYGTNRTIELEWGRVTSIDGVQFVHANTCTQQLTLFDGIGYIRNDKAGIVDLIPKRNLVCTCGAFGQFPYKVRVAYTSGFTTGTVSAMPAMLMGLTTAASLVLQEILDPGMNEGQIGIQEFKSMRYEEIRVQFMRDTPFGSSALAQYAAKLLEQWRVFTAGRL
jgi:hypothetical protein